MYLCMWTPCEFSRTSPNFGWSNLLTKVESYRYLMITNFDEKSNKIFGHSLKTFEDLGGKETLKIIPLKGKHYLFQYREEAQYAFIHRFDNETIELERKLWVKEPFDFKLGLFIIAAGKMQDEMTIFACGVRNDPDICYFAHRKQFNRIAYRKPTKTFFHSGTGNLRNAIKGITTLDGHFVSANI